MKIVKESVGESTKIRLFRLGHDRLGELVIFVFIIPGPYTNRLLDPKLTFPGLMAFVRNNIKN